jgi:hypothetical protein
VSIPVPGGMQAGVDLFTANFLPPTFLSPSVGSWTQSITNPGEVNYKFIKNSFDGYLIGDKRNSQKNIKIVANAFYETFNN